MEEDLRGLEAIFGLANGRVEGRESSAFLPLVFRLHSPDSRRLEFVVTDYHDNTWEASRSIEQLQDLRDEVGIGGTWNDFVSYMKAAFQSGNVTLTLGGPATALAGRGATSGKIVAQKSKGMPLVKFILTKLSDTDASDRMADVAVHACRSWRGLSTSLATEQAEASRLRLDLEAEKLKTSQLEDKIDTLTGKKRKPGKDSLAISESSLLEQQEQQQPAPKSKPKHRRVAPVSTRSKRKGTAIVDEDEDD